MTSVEKWSFVPFAGANFVGNSAYLWCRYNVTPDDWDHNAKGFLFKNEKDAIMFTLKWS